MESAEFWKKLLPNLCDNSNRKIMFALAAFFRKICREDGYSGEMPWRNLAERSKSDTSAKRAKAQHWSNCPSCTADTPFKGSGEKTLWDHSFLGGGSIFRPNMNKE
jgi:hypothetical protein